MSTAAAVNINNINYCKLDNEALIYCVEARPALWHSRHKDHKNRFKKRLLWAEVAAAVLPDVCDAEAMVQKRWKSLRDKFRRLIIAQRSAQKNGIKTEEATDATTVDDVTWPYYEQLLFLKNSMEGIPLSNNVNVSEEPSEEILLGIAPYGDVDCVSLLSAESNHDAPPAASPSTDSQAMVSDLSDQEIATVEPADIEPAPQRRQRKRKKEDEDLQQQLDEVSNLLEKHKPPDEDEHFAMSLVSHMRAVKPENKLEMRVKVLQIVQRFKEQ